jgi:glutamine synthetase
MAELSESCRDAIDLIVADKVRLKAVVMERLAEIYLALKQGNYSKAEELVKDLLLYLDL